MRPRTKLIFATALTMLGVACAYSSTTTIQTTTQPNGTSTTTEVSCTTIDVLQGSLAYSSGLTGTLAVEFKNEDGTEESKEVESGETVEVPEGTEAIETESGSDASRSTEEAVLARKTLRLEPHWRRFTDEAYPSALSAPMISMDVVGQGPSLGRPMTSRQKVVNAGRRVWEHYQAVGVSQPMIEPAGVDVHINELLHVTYDAANRRAVFTFLDYVPFRSIDLTLEVDSVPYYFDLASPGTVQGSTAGGWHTASIPVPETLLGPGVQTVKLTSVIKKQGVARLGGRERIIRF